MTEILRRLPIDQRTRHRLRSLQRRLRRWAGFPVALPGNPPDTFRPTQRAPDRIDFVFFGIVDWHFRFQRPQQLAVQLARRGHRVLYVSSDFIDDGGVGIRVEQLDNLYALYQVHLSVRGAPGISWQPASGALVDQLRRRFHEAMQWSGWHAPVFVLGHPFWSLFCGSGEYVALVYDRMDFHEGFGSVSGASREAEQELMRCADLTVCSSRCLEQAFRYSMSINSSASRVGLLDMTCNLASDWRGKDWEAKDAMTSPDVSRTAWSPASLIDQHRAILTGFDPSEGKCIKIGALCRRLVYDSVGFFDFQGLGLMQPTLSPAAY